MAQTSNPKLDPRFRALAAIPDVPFTEGLSPALAHLHPTGSFFPAIVLLAAGSQLPTMSYRRVVEILNDTYIVEAELGVLQDLAENPGILYVEAPRPADMDLTHSVPVTGAHHNWARPLALTGRGILVGIVDPVEHDVLDDVRTLGVLAQDRYNRRPSVARGVASTMYRIRVA